MKREGSRPAVLAAGRDPLLRADGRKQRNGLSTRKQRNGLSILWTTEAGDDKLDLIYAQKGRCSGESGCCRSGYRRDRTPKEVPDMIQRRPYSAGGVKHAFWFNELRRVIELRSAGESWAEIRRQALEGNLFGASTPRRAQQIYHTVSARVRCLDESFCPVFLQIEVSSQRVLALIAAMVYDALLAEFVYEVVRDKLIVGDTALTDAEIRAFFLTKQGQDETVSGWTDQTLRRLGKYYKTMLREAGILNGGRGRETLRKPVLDPEAETWLKSNGMEYCLNAVEGVR